MSHTEEFNKIMAANKKPRATKVAPVEVKLIGARDNMNDMQRDLSKCTISGCVISLPFEKLPNYDQVRKALLQAGAEYKKSTFIFPNDAQPYIDRLMGGESVNIKKEFQFFATPSSLADKLVSLAEVETGHRILEPSAGQGSLISAIERLEIPVEVVAIELMDINIKALSTKLKTHPIKYIQQVSLQEGDFLKAEFSSQFDRIIANPPFSKSQDADHIQHMYKFCKSGGKVAAIASIGWMYSSIGKGVKFRSWLDSDGAMSPEEWKRFCNIGTDAGFTRANGDHVYMEMLEAGEFQESGTSVRTCIIVISKV